VVVEAAGEDPRSVGDVADRGGEEALLREELAGDLDDLGAAIGAGRAFASAVLLRCGDASRGHDSRPFSLIGSLR